MNVIEVLFDELKVIHKNLFNDEKKFASQGNKERKNQENNFFIKFVLLLSHPEFYSESSIRTLIKKRRDYRGESIGIENFVDCAQEYFLYQHSGQSGQRYGEMTSLCEKSGPLKAAISVYEFRKHYVQFLTWRIEDERRDEKKERKYTDEIFPLQVSGFRYKDALDQDLKMDDTELGVSELSFSQDDDEDDDRDVLPGWADIVPEQEEKIYRNQHSLAIIFGIRFISKDECILSEKDLKSVAIAAKDFFDLKQVKGSLNDLTRKRLGVWGAFFIKRDDTYRTNGSLATTSGYAQMASNLGLGTPAVVGDTLNRKLGIARGYDCGKSKKQITLMETFFQTRGWGPSAGESKESCYWKLLIAKSFCGVLAQIALDYTESKLGFEINVPSYKDEDHDE